MKSPFIKNWPTTLVVALGLAASAPLSAQSVVTTTREVTSEGTISSLEPQSFVIHSETASAPLTYSYGTKTVYVDDSGAVISREVIRPGTPVTIHYVREGDRALAERVVVHRTATAAVAPATETTTRTTTTTTETPPLTRKEAREEARHERKMEKEAREHPERVERREVEIEARRPLPPPATTAVTETRRVVEAPAPAVAVTTTTEPVGGTISTFAPDRFTLTTVEHGPITYRYTPETSYVDEDGNRVDVALVKQGGAPVTVRYRQEGELLIADRVVVHRRAGPPAVRRLPPR